ncbi:MAG: PEP-CTERM sorting domain-containing protein [Pirellulales bacterium]|nr:PEP-CTERM sorting domain-containing protein [Pirellulales bacterium]
MKTRFLRAMGSLIVLGIVVGSVQATTITFNGAASGSNADIPANYGSRITGDSTGFVTTDGTGATGNVQLTWSPSDYWDYHTGAFWESLGTPVFVAQIDNANTAEDRTGTIRFTMDHGRTLVLNSLDIGHASDQTEDPYSWTIRVQRISDGAIVFNTTTAALGPTDTEHVTINFTGDPNEDYNLLFDDNYTSLTRRGAIDNLSFSQQMDAGVGAFELAVDRATGSMTFRNVGTGAGSLLAYSIRSGVGALDQSKWKSIAGNYDAGSPGPNQVDPDDDWTILSNPASSTDLSESELGGGDGASLGGSAAIDLGMGAWIQNPKEDLSMEILLPDGKIRQVPVVFEGNGGNPFGIGDLNFDGTIDALDWPIYNAGRGVDLTGLSGPAAYKRGDLDSDFDNDIADFLIFKGMFVSANGAEAFANLAGVPEPTSVFLLIAGAAFLGITSSGRHNMKALKLFFLRSAGWLGMAAVLGVCLIGSMAVPAQGVEIGGLGDYATAFLSSVPVGWNDISGCEFDASGRNLFLIRDTGTAADAGLYAITFSSDYATGTLSSRLALGNLANPSDLTVDANGAVYVVYDYTAAVRKVTNPLGAATETDIFAGSGFLGGAGDDDPFGIEIAPPGFSGTGVSPGDLILADNGFDANDTNAVHAVAPDGSSYHTLTTWTSLPNYTAADVNLANIEVDATRGIIYLAPAAMTQGTSTYLFTIDAAGTLTEHTVLMPAGANLSNMQSMAVNPIDGSIWVADDDAWPSDTYVPDDAIYRIDPDTFVATLEIDFIAEPGNTTQGRGFPNFNYNSMAFTPDGRHLMVADVDDGSNTANSIMVFGVKTAVEVIPLSLAVNRNTGEVILKNNSGQSITIDSYEITSESNSLDPIGWNSLEEQDYEGNGAPGTGNGWEEAGGIGTHQLIESYLLGDSELTDGTSISLGFAYDYDKPAAAEDLVFSYHVAGDPAYLRAGLVTYFDGEVNNADFDGDSDVDGADFLAWQKGFGMTSGATRADGDANADGSVNATDLAVWKSQFGTGGAASQGLAGTAVPEPGTLGLLLLAAVGLAFGGCRRCRPKSMAKILVMASVVIVAIGQMATATTTVDRLYQFGEDPNEYPYEGGSFSLTYDSQVIDTLSFSDQQFLEDIIGLTTYTNVGTSGLKRPGVGTSTAWGAKFNGVDAYLSGTPLNRPDETVGPTKTGAGPLLYDMPFNYDGITARGLQMWVYPDQAGLDAGKRQTVVMDTVAMGGVAITASGLWTQINDGHMNDTDIAATVEVVGNTWHHVMQHVYHSTDPGAPKVLDGSGSSDLGFTGVVYVNGIAVSANNDTPNPNDLKTGSRTGLLTVGAEEVTLNTFASYFHGVVDDLEMYVFGDNSSQTGPPAGQNYGTFDLFTDNDWIVNKIGTSVPGGVLVPGDVNRDGAVNNGDVTAFVTGWLSEKRLEGAHNDTRVGDWETWGWGDMDHDGIVYLADAFILHEALLAAGQGGLDFSLLNGGAVPEPSSLLLVVVGVVFIAGIRRCVKK